MRSAAMTHPVKYQTSQGIVIVVVLMVVFLMTTLLVYTVDQQHLLVRRIGNQNVSEQGYQYAQGVNAWAQRVLQDDVNRQVDFLGEDWAKFGKPEQAPNSESESFSLALSSAAQEDDEELATIDFGIDGLEFEIIDLQGRFNLNNLAVKDPGLLNGQKRIFLNLLDVLEIGDFDQRESLLAALVDWVDRDDREVANGIESGLYSVKRTPYYAADQALTSVGELRYVRGFSPRIISKIKPFVAALPVNNAKININTTSAEVLGSLSSVPVVDLSSVTAFLAARDNDAFTGFTDAGSAQNAITGVSPVGRVPVAGMMQVNSQFFQINTKVQLGEFEYCMRTVVLRSIANRGAEAQAVSVLSRQHDTLCDDQISTIEDAEPRQDATDENLS